MNLVAQSAPARLCVQQAVDEGPYQRIEIGTHKTERGVMMHVKSWLRQRRDILRNLVEHKRNKAL
jgi:hypothetical protein